MRKYRKVYVSVEAVFDTDGNIIPVKVKWEDGRAFKIDKVLHCQRAASLKAGGQGMRYTCKINGRERYLFYDESKWFVEAYEL